ncbi:uncharacterized protein LOC141666577 isoform X3 [Apium graveolens]|uniref:uncharacterized protein LOC141666577 isoform X3 n=1 Tax=Apium graveolens TaxID=4045 RepID=UPI003D790CAA
MEENINIKKFHWMDLCIKCDKSNGKLLACHENACPLVVHEDCLGCEAQFDDLGNFGCPYCAFKRASEEVVEAERKRAVAEKNLFKYLGGKGVGVGGVERGNVTGGGDVRDQCGEVEKNVIGPECIVRDEGADDVLLVDDDDFDRVKVVEKQNGGGRSDRCNGEGKVDKQKDVHMNERSQSGDKIQNGATEIETFPEYHQGEGHFKAQNFMEENVEEAEENEGRMDEVKNKEQANKTVEKTVCKESVHQVHMEAKKKVNDTTTSACTDTDTISKKVTGKKPSGVDIPKGSSRKSSKKVAKPPAVFRNSLTLYMKRKRSTWKVEEEDMLKKGVLKHSELVNKNIPWKKILEEGRDVFNESRTPKIVCKESVPQVHMEAKKNVIDSTASTCMGTDTISEKVTGEKPSGVNIPKGSSRKSSKKVAKPPAVLDSLTLYVKRKRSAWKVEEEDMLKKGVLKHSELVNKNIPWKKILEEGRDVFDENRTPADLKDKWRNILSKEPLFQLS